MNQRDNKHEENSSGTLQRKVAMRTSLHALSVEDSNADFNLLKLLISKHFPSFELDHVKTSKDLFERLDRRNYDVILLDLMLGAERGTHLIQSLKEILPMGEIVIVSGQNDIRTAVECASQGVPYVVKGRHLETDLLKTLSSVSRLLHSKKEISVLQSIVFQAVNFPMVLFKMGRHGLKMTYKDFEQFPEDLSISLDDYLRKLGTYLAIAVGQGHEYHTGLLQLPAGSSKQFQMMVYGFRLEDKQAVDQRLAQGYLLFCLFTKKDIFSLLPVTVLEPIFEEQFATLSVVEELDPGKLIEIKSKIIESLRNHSTLT
ncbi:MAG: response regulator [Candidatus Hodarchaeales archaeon]|jgi:ActR/RegA family two-component response regulator